MVLTLAHFKYNRKKDLKIRKEECQICFHMRRPTDFVSPCVWCKDKQRICKLCCAKLCTAQRHGKLLYKCVACRRTSLLQGHSHGRCVPIPDLSSVHSLFHLLNLPRGLFYPVLNVAHIKSRMPRSLLNTDHQHSHHTCDGILGSNHPPYLEQRVACLEQLAADQSEMIAQLQILVERLRQQNTTQTDFLTELTRVD